MTTIYEYAEKNVCDEALKDPAWKTVLSDVYIRMMTGFYDQKILDVILQKYRCNYDIYDAYSFTLIFSAIFTGDVAIMELNIGEKPFADKEVKKNNETISRVEKIELLENINSGIQENTGKIFRGEFWGGLADSDGIIEWKKSIRMHKFSEDGSSTIINVPGRSVPLEVGYTSGGRTYNHLFSEHGLARWPYESTNVTLLVLINKDRFYHPLLDKKMNKYIFRKSM
jgi:hypothetical protein